MTDHENKSHAQLLAEALNFLSDEPDRSYLVTPLDALWAGVANAVDAGANASYLTMSRAEMMAATLNGIDAGANASHLTMGEAELLAAIVNALDPTQNASAETWSIGELYAGLRDASEAGGADELAPPSPTAVDLVAGSDTGSSSTDDITTDTTPEIDVTFGTVLAENDEVHRFVDGVLDVEHTVTLAEAGGETLAFGSVTPIPAGVHSITFKHNRPSGGDHISNASPALSITIDSTAPTVSTFFPADNATDVAGNVTLVLTFDEPIALGSAGTITLKKTSDDSTVDSWDVATDEGSGAGQLEVLNDDELTLHLSGNLTGGLAVYGVWDAGFVTDIAGNNVAAQASTTAWSFTVVAGAYETESDAIFAGFSTPPDDTRKGVINTLVLALKTGAISGSNIWNKLDVLYVLGASEAQGARLNWKNPGTFNCTAVNAPTFTTDQGYAGNGTSSYLDTGWTPSVNGSQFVQNSACLFVWSRTNTRANSAATVGAATSDAPAVAYINPWNNTVDNVSHGLNGASGANAFAPGSAAGFFCLSREGVDAATHYDVFRNTTKLGTQASNSAGRSDQVMRICGANVSTNFTTRQVLFAGAGGGLTDNEEADLYNALDAYRSAIGA